MYKTEGGDKSLLWLFRYLLHKPVIKSIIRDRESIISKLKLYSLLAFYHDAYSFKQWLKRKYFIPGHPDYVIYTFWFCTNTLRASIIDLEENLNIVICAHKYDIFDNQVVFRSHYLRTFTLSRIENVFVCSNNGAEHIKRSYPLFADKIKTSYLDAKKLLNEHSSPNENPKKLTFLSVSRLHPV